MDLTHFHQYYCDCLVLLFRDQDASGCEKTLGRGRERITEGSGALIIRNGEQVHLKVQPLSTFNSRKRNKQSEHGYKNRGEENK